MDTTLLAEDTVKKAVKRGCDAAEVFIKTAIRLSVEVKDGRVEALESSRDFGMSLKVIRHQKLGFSFATKPEAAEDIIHEALKGADWTAEDKYVDVPDGQAASEALVLDEKIKNLKEDDIIKNALLLEKKTLDFDARIRKVRKAEIGYAVGNTTIVNSRGIKVSYESAYLSAHVSALASEKGDSQMGWEYGISRRLSDIDFSAIAEGASRRAIELLGARKISTLRVPVILDSSVASDFIGIFSASLSAEAVQKKRSFLAGKDGSKIMSPIIRIVDDGLMPWGIGTKPVDDEGVPASRQIVVSDGVLTGFMHNTYTANKQGTASTGNAARGSFKSLPGIDATNLYIETAKGRKPEAGNRRDNLLIQSVSRGLLISEAMGVHTADPVSGDFSIGVSGLWIENGEITYPVKEAIMSGNVLELFNRVERVGNDLRMFGKIGSPSLLIGEMDISA